MMSRALATAPSPCSAYQDRLRHTFFRRRSTKFQRTPLPLFCQIQRSDVIFWDASYLLEMSCLRTAMLHCHCTVNILEPSS